MMAVTPLASGRSGKRKLSSTADRPLLVVIKVHATVRLAPRNATVSPEVTLTYRAPGRSVIDRVAVSTVATEPYKSALEGGNGAHAEAMPRTVSASAIREASLAVMMRLPIDLRQSRCCTIKSNQDIPTLTLLKRYILDRNTFAGERQGVWSGLQCGLIPA